MSVKHLGQRSAGGQGAVCGLLSCEAEEMGSPVTGEDKDFASSSCTNYVVARAAVHPSLHLQKMLVITLQQCFSTVLTPHPFDTVPHVVLTPTHRLFSLLLQ